MHVLKTLYSNTLAVHSYYAQSDGESKSPLNIAAMGAGSFVGAGYIPIVGLVPAALKTAVIAIAWWSYMVRNEKSPFNPDEDATFKGTMHATILILPRAAIEAVGLGILLIPVDLLVTAVHLVMQQKGMSDVYTAP